MGAVASRVLGGSAGAAPVSVRSAGASYGSLVVTLTGVSTAGPVVQTDEALVFLPSVIPPEQVYYWTRAWQRCEQETREDFAAGHVRRFSDPDDAIMWLMSRSDD